MVSFTQFEYLFNLILIEVSENNNFVTLTMSQLS